MRIGVLTGGGDCPGLNAVIRAVVITAEAGGDEVVGFRDGWRGPLKGSSRPLAGRDVVDLLARGGAVLGSSRTNPYAAGEGGAEAVRATMTSQGVDALVVTGAESRAAVLGHVQRGGTPTAYDRVLATRFGVQAVAALRDGATGSMVALRGTDIVRVDLGEATRELKTVPADRLDEAEVFFG